MPGEIVTMVAGGVTLVASFLPLYQLGPLSWSSWSSSFSIVPLLPIAVLVCVGVAALVALRTLVGIRPPRRVWIYSWTQFEIVVSVLAGVTTLTYAMRSSGGRDTALGGWLMALGAMGVAVGTCIARAQREPRW